MKKYLYLIFILILITNVTAISNDLIAGSNNTITTIDKCSFLRVYITADEAIDENEYNFPYCEEVEENKWYCQCIPETNYDLIMDINLMAYNTYNFDIEIYGIQPNTITNTRTRTNTIVINETKDKDPIIEKETEIIVETVVEEVEVIVKEKEYINETTPIIIQEAEKSRWWLWLIIAILVIIIAFLLLFYYSYKDSNADYIPINKND